MLLNSPTINQLSAIRETINGGVQKAESYLIVYHLTWINSAKYSLPFKMKFACAFLVLLATAFCFAEGQGPLPDSSSQGSGIPGMSYIKSVEEVVLLCYLLKTNCKKVVGNL